MTNDMNFVEQDDSTEYRYEFPSVSRRICASIIDVSSFLFIGQLVSFLWGANVLEPVPSLAVTVSMWVLKSIMETRSGKTLGKYICKIQLLTRRPSSRSRFPGLSDSLLRNSWLLIELIPIIGTVLSLLVSIVLIMSMVKGETTIGLHDRLAETTIRFNSHERSSN
ncbi:RDD family protein [Corynebacterium sp. S7]